MSDPVNHPSHYTDGVYEVISFIEAWGLGYHMGNAVKYISRAGKKNPSKRVEDLQKAAWYLDRAAKARYFRLYKDPALDIPPQVYAEDKKLTPHLAKAIQHICDGFPKLALMEVQAEIDRLGGAAV